MLSRILTKLGLKKPAPPAKPAMIHPSKQWPRASTAAPAASQRAASSQPSRASSSAIQPPAAASASHHDQDLTAFVMLHSMSTSAATEPSRTCWTPPADSGSSYSSDCGSSDSSSSCSSD